MTSRHDRRAQAAEQRKLSRHATNEEIFPGTHGPVQPEAADLMRATIDGLKNIFGPNYHFTLFVIEKEKTAGRDAPRFNYISTIDRPDMVACLRAFVARNETGAAKLDKVIEAPPTGSRQ